VLSLGAYVPIWFGLTWSELRKERNDDQMYPLGHALSTLIPGWNAWQAWRHFRAIDALLEGKGQGRVDATSAALGLVIWWLTFTHYSSDPLFLVLDALELLAGSAVVLYGQRAMNLYWASKGGEERVLETDLIALGVVVTYAVFTIIGFLSTTP
jgi:hypothetical protein